MSQEGGELPLRPGTHALGKVKDPGDEALGLHGPHVPGPVQIEVQAGPEAGEAYGEGVDPLPGPL